MADKRRRRKPSRRSLIGPLLMLGSGAALGGVLWHVLMADRRPPAPVNAPERLSQQDQQALDGLLQDHGSRH